MRISSYTCAKKIICSVRSKFKLGLCGFIPIGIHCFVLEVSYGGGPRLGRTVNCTGIILAPIYQTSENTIDYTVPPCSTNRIDLLQPAGADDAMTTLLQTSSLHRLLSRDRRRLPPPLHSSRYYVPDTWF